MIEHVFHIEIGNNGIGFIVAALIGIPWLMVKLELLRRKYRKLWCEEAQRHCNARLELHQWIETAKHNGEACCAHKSTIAKLKMEVTRLHEELDELKPKLPWGVKVATEPGFLFARETTEPLPSGVPLLHPDGIVRVSEGRKP